MIRNSWLFNGSLLLALTITACQSEKEIVFSEVELIKGNASPIRLLSGKTEINLEDYVIDPSLIDSISPPEGVMLSRKNNTVHLLGDLKYWLGALQLWHDGQSYSIPLRKSNQSDIHIRYDGTAKDVRIKGEFNAWTSVPMNRDETGYSITFTLNPGNYQYVLILDGTEQRDPSNDDFIDNGLGGWNSILRIPRQPREALPLLETTSVNDKTIILSLQKPAQQVQVFWKNFLLTTRYVTPGYESISITIPAQAEKEKRTFIRVWASNEAGISNDVLIPLVYGKVVSSASQLTRQDKESQVLYFLMVDRFVNGNPDNDEPVQDKSIHPKANYYGGDLAGISQKIKEGYFRDLGITTLWLSPISQNPKGAYGKYPNPPTTFSGYHGYWPVSLTQIDYRFGTKDDFKELLSLAHEQNINVILDYVAHHIHQEHPMYKQYPEWFTSLYLPDGSLNTERWDDERLTTWFDTFMPTLDLRKPEVVEPMTDTAMVWLEHYELDGFRHDASKHIDLLFWRELTKKVKKRISRSIYQIGETYGSRELVNSYVNTGMLDGQFDFNVYDDAVNTFARNEVPFTRLATSLTESISWFGDHNLMGYISGNQDRARFISYADGSISFDEDAKLAGWTRQIEVKDTIGYSNLQSLMAFTMTIPGVPVIYYADEIGDPGGNDPDNRRMMRFTNLSKHEAHTKEVTQKLVWLRRNNLALLYGDFRILFVTDKQFIYMRKYFDNEVIVAFNKSSDAVTIELPELRSQFNTNFSGRFKSSDGKNSLFLPANSFDVLIK